MNMPALQRNPQYDDGNKLRRGWTTNEVAQLKRHAAMGADFLADELDRTIWSVRNKARELRISLRRSGSTSGRIMGQPRWVSILHPDAPGYIAALRQLRADALAGTVDLGRIERRARLLAQGAALCPRCVRRPVEVATTGLCGDCHLRGLAEGHAMESQRADAQRELDRERQRKHRRKGGEEGEQG